MKCYTWFTYSRDPPLAGTLQQETCRFSTRHGTATHAVKKWERIWSVILIDALIRLLFALQ
jgi:hypothetical protein